LLNHRPKIKKILGITVRETSAILRRFVAILLGKKRRLLRITAMRDEKTLTQGVEEHWRWIGDRAGVVCERSSTRGRSESGQPTACSMMRLKEQRL
jgi:hypothetical protein